MLWSSGMVPGIQLDDIVRHRRQIGIAAAGTVAAIGIAWWIVRRRRPSAEEIERRRRQRLAGMGRIIDGTITDLLLTETTPASHEDPTTPPRVIFYRYIIAGVSYECAQDVSTLSDHIENFRIDAPAQVKYDPHNPANSIILSESWTGLYLSAAATSPAPARKPQTTSH